MEHIILTYKIVGLCQAYVKILREHFSSYQNELSVKWPQRKKSHKKTLDNEFSFSVYIALVRLGQSLQLLCPNDQVHCSVLLSISSSYSMMITTYFSQVKAA